MIGKNSNFLDFTDAIVKCLRRLDELDDEVNHLKTEVKKLNDENKYLHLNLALAINEIKILNKKIENKGTIKK